ncbi:hypothetical protein ABTN67_23045, partial [Acinetobacter baumannii]
YSWRASSAISAHGLALWGERQTVAALSPRSLFFPANYDSIGDRVESRYSRLSPDAGTGSLVLQFG